MAQVIFGQNNGAGNAPSYWIIDRRVPAMQVPGFYVTDMKYATRMTKEEAAQYLYGNLTLQAIATVIYVD